MLTWSSIGPLGEIGDIVKRYVTCAGLDPAAAGHSPASGPARCLGLQDPGVLSGYGTNGTVTPRKSASL